MWKAEAWINEERERAKQCLDSSSEAAIVKVRLAHFLPMFPICAPWKQESLYFCDVFNGYRKRSLVRNGLISWFGPQSQIMKNIGYIFYHAKLIAIQLKVI